MRVSSSFEPAARLGTGLDDPCHERAAGQFVKGLTSKNSLGEVLHFVGVGTFHHSGDEALVLGEEVTEATRLFGTTLNVIVFKRTEDRIA